MKAAEVSLCIIFIVNNIVLQNSYHQFTPTDDSGRGMLASEISAK